MDITIEALEMLATEIETEAEGKRARLLRLCTAYTRILAQREPSRFVRAACHYGDEAGHYDSSFPPDQEYSERTGPRVLKLIGDETEDVATSGGFYYSWRRVTTYGGLWVGRDGTWYRSDETGTGRLGQYAAHPGDCDVDVTVDWQRTRADELTLAELSSAEVRLRELAFPLVAARAEAQA